MVKVEFKPFKRPDARFAIEVLRNDKSIGFVHWIESTDGRICRIDRPDMVMCPIWTEEECQANCNWLNQAYLDGRVQ